MGKGKLIIGIIMGAVLLFFIVGAVFNDTSDQIAGMNDSTYYEIGNETRDVKGINLIKLLPLLLAIGIVIAGVKYVRQGS